MTYSTLLLDFDHTLFDSDTAESAAFADTLRQCNGISDPDAHFSTYQKINRTLWSAVEQGRIDPNEVHAVRFERLAAALGLDANPATMADAFVQAMGANGDLYPGARETLAQLAASATLALVTNALSEIQRVRIDRLNIGVYFDAIVISTEVGSSKPSPTIFDIVFERLGKPRKQTAVLIGDSLSSDIRGGTNWRRLPDRRRTGQVSRGSRKNRTQDLRSDGGGIRAGPFLPFPLDRDLHDVRNLGVVI